MTAIDEALLSLIAAEDTPAFAEPLTWYSNGERGHLHLTKRCSKLTTRKTPTHERTLRLRDVLGKKRICQDCMSHPDWNEAQREIARAARKLQQAAQEPALESLSGGVRQSAAPLIVRERTRLYNRAVRAMVVQETSYPGLESWQQRVLDQLDARLPEGPDYGAIQTESAYITAAAVLLRRMQAGVFTNANWRDREIGTFFGDWHANDFHGGLYRSSPLVKCIRQWLELVGGGADVHGATKLLLTDPQRLEETLGTPTADQLRRCRLSRPARESENAWQYVENVWREQALRLLDTALAELVEAIDDLRAPAAPVLLAHSRYNSNDFSVTPYTSNRESVVVAVQKVIVANGRAVITTHPTVAEYLVPESGRYSDWSGAVKRETVPSEDILETALMLWSPRERDSSYVKFEEALEAAEVL